jgi:hypothetical protein
MGHSEIPFSCEDWTAFRNLDGLGRKAGTSQDRLGEVVVKELVDNALDESGDCDLKIEGSTVTVRDYGKGIPGTNDEIAELFSINRTQISAKLIRMPTRGALGNGLRVVGGAQVATGGELLIATRGRELKIIPDAVTGKSKAVRVGKFSEPGTRIRITPGRPLEFELPDLGLGMIAIAMAHAQGENRYGGKSSPFWYDTDAFYELLQAAGSMLVRKLISKFDGCSGAKAGEIAAEFLNRTTSSLTKAETGRLLEIAKENAKEVSPKRLGAIGPKGFGGAYARIAESAYLPRSVDGSRVKLPFVVEAWAEPSTGESASVMFLVNCTPCITDAADAQYKEKSKSTTVWGPALNLDVKTGKNGIDLHVNIITPFMPMTSDGKEPALGLFHEFLQLAIDKAARGARRWCPKDAPKVDIKAVVFAHMDEQINIVSDNRSRPFYTRQVFYRMRPIVQQETGQELDAKYFSQVLFTKWEEVNGREEKVIRDPRGSFYTPHIDETIPLGTVQVETFDRPLWQFNKVVYVEKEGIAGVLKAEGWPEKHDCALMTSKGFSTRAARDMIDLIAGTGEPVVVFCLHDCDPAGSMICETLQRATKARGARSVKIVDLGLNPWDAVALADAGEVQIETVRHKKRQKVAAYIDEHPCWRGAGGWGDWLQTNRCELDALATPRLIEFLDENMADQPGKVNPPPKVAKRRLRDQTRELVRKSIINQVLAGAGIERRVKRAMASLAPQLATVAKDLSDTIAESLENAPQRHWSSVVDDQAADIAGVPNPPEETETDDTGAF